MSKTKQSKARVPKVRIARPASRPLQLRYTDRLTGKEVRISTNTHDEDEAAEQKKDLEARLRLGMAPQRRDRPDGPISWEEFRERYSTLQLATLKAPEDAESPLDVIERIAKPKLLQDIANTNALHDLQARLLAGEESRFRSPRSPHTVKSFMAVLLAALRWAKIQGYIANVPEVRRLKVAKIKAMKGRPITTEEFERMLAATEKVVGKAATPSWQRLLRGLWESALRLDELLNVAWDVSDAIVPNWPRGRFPTLSIPASMQKNNTLEEIPLLPGFEAVLKETPERERTGYVFAPAHLSQRGHAQRPAERPRVDWVGKVIGRIGEAANVMVEPAKGTPPAAASSEPRKGKPGPTPKAKRPTRTAEYKPPKFASAHDLRRGWSQRMVDQGVPEGIVQAVMRHASFQTTRRHYAPGNVQALAATMRKHLTGNVPRYTQEVQ
jgi:integrase